MLFLSGSKTLLWSEIQRFSPSNMSCFFSLDRRGCFGAKLSEFSASNMQLFFALDRRGCFGAKLSDFFSLDRRGCFGAKLCDFQHEHAAVLFSLAKRLLLDRFLFYFAPCSNNPFLPCRMELVHSVVRSLPLRPEATSLWLKKKRPLRELCFSHGSGAHCASGLCD